jgi:ribosomal protein S18 acetylase RimI-like enzyme
MIALDRLPTDEDPLLVWTAQQMRTGARVWALGDAAAVACREVSRRDRLALRGSPADVAELVRRIRPLVAGFNPVADEALIDAVAARVDGFEPVARFGWMDTTTPSPVRVAGEPHWLTDAELPELTALLAAEHPGSWAKPGDAGVRRWAGLRDADGVLQAVAADAWSVPEIGFVAGVATRGSARGRGLGTTICAFLTDELIKDRGRVALMVDTGNVAAIRTYDKLGYRLRPIAAARLSPP